MDHKEKYVQAVERGRIFRDHLLETGDKGIAWEIEYIFPELKESEDERIKKTIIRILKGEIGYTSKEDIDKYVTWLEKQGEKKPADNVKPKFHKGEWLCENEPNNYARFIQILETANVQGKERYRISRDIHNDEDIAEFGFVEKYYHKFDIHDAMDGDVLVLETDEVEWIFMYREIVPAASEVPHDLLRYYFLLEGNYFNRSGVCAMVTEDYEEYLKPATKEQRDLLFQKMKEEGYELDSEKKELKKISDYDTKRANIKSWY